MNHTVAEIILPLPLQQTYSYLADSVEDSLKVGMRVIVSFGPRRFHTGIVYKIDCRENVNGLKDVISLLDDYPIVFEKQLELWEWMSRYYQCSIGEIMKAALPSAFKMESETFITKCEVERELKLSAKEMALLDKLGSDAVSIGTFSKLVGIKNLFPILKSLQGKGAIVLSEEVIANYKPRTVTYVRVVQRVANEGSITEVLASLHHSPKQLQLFSTLVDITGVIINEPSEVSKKELIEASKVSGNILNELKKKGLVECYEKEIARIVDVSAERKPYPLNKFQQEAYEAIHKNFEEKSVVLLHGVTSSGKTEIYIHLIEEMLQQGKQVLYLVPEIALTTQLSTRLKKVFGEQLGIYHSRFTDNERAETWNNVLLDKGYRIILGVRSSIFLPFNNLGLIIVDEEHDASFKQYDPAPRYNARNIATILAKQHKAKVLLGSATPSIESYSNAKGGKYGLVVLNQRFEEIEMPKIEVVNLQDCYHQYVMRGHFSPQLLEHIQRTLNNNEQVILFQNRRGYAPYVECKQCAWVPKCPNCDVSLTYHQKFNKLTCHYCGFSMPLPEVCPECKQDSIETKGFGTEQIEAEVKQLFPKVSVLRMDLDTTTSKSAYERIISAFEEQEAQILIGTQIVTKGLDFAHVGLVGILNADNLLNYPDFRAHERAYQLLTQVSGRAGRKGKQGLVVLQTSSPEHPIVQQVKDGDYETFFVSQMNERHAFSYPPYYRLTTLEIKHKDISVLQRAANQLGKMLRDANVGIVLGPTNPPVSRIQNLFIKQFMVKIAYSTSLFAAKEAISSCLQNMIMQDDFKQIRINFDVDPM